MKDTVHEKQLQRPTAWKKSASGYYCLKNCFSQVNHSQVVPPGSLYSTCPGTESLRISEMGIFTSWMSFMPPNQCQNIAGNTKH